MKIYGEGIATVSESGQMLDVYFPNIEFGEHKTDYKTLQVNSGTQEIIKFAHDSDNLNFARSGCHRRRLRHKKRHDNFSGTVNV